MREVVMISNVPPFAPFAKPSPMPAPSQLVKCSNYVRNRLTDTVTGHLVPLISLEFL